jgi:FkbM family methyltransferase
MGNVGCLGVNVVGRLRSRASYKRDRATVALARLRTQLFGVGVDVPLGSSQRLSMRVLPAAARDSQLMPDLDIVSASVTAARGEVGFVQVGAYDGQANDPMHDLVRRLGWRGILVEPQPDAFERLREAYADVEGLVFLNAAVAEERGSRTLWHIAGSEPDDPWWKGQVSSFDRDHLLKHIRGDTRLVARVVGTPVPTVTVEDVLSRAPRRVDVVQVDTEGYDAAIIAMLPLDQHQPDLIRFEHRHLAPQEHAKAVGRLVAYGYRVAVNEDDTIAMQHRPGRGLTARA